MKPAEQHSAPAAVLGAFFCRPFSLAGKIILGEARPYGQTLYNRRALPNLDGKKTFWAKPGHARPDRARRLWRGRQKTCAAHLILSGLPLA
jgi:hypothetical protein